MKLSLLYLEAYLLADLFNVHQYIEIKQIQYLLKIEKQCRILPLTNFIFYSHPKI